MSIPMLSCILKELLIFCGNFSCLVWVLCLSNVLYSQTMELLFVTDVHAFCVVSMSCNMVNHMNDLLLLAS